MVPMFSYHAVPYCTPAFQDSMCCARSCVCGNGDCMPTHVQVLAAATVLCGYHASLVPCDNVSGKPTTLFIAGICILGQASTKSRGTSAAAPDTCTRRPATQHPETPLAAATAATAAEAANGTSCTGRASHRCRAGSLYRCVRICRSHAGGLRHQCARQWQHSTGGTSQWTAPDHCMGWGLACCAGQAAVWRRLEGGAVIR